MSSASTTPSADPAPVSSTVQLVQSCVQFLRVVRYRQSVLIGCLVISGLLGGLYHATATRLYQARASLLVLQTGADVTNTTMTAEGSRQGLMMPTYERLFLTAVVLEGAVKYLEPVDRADLDNAPRENWANMIRGNLGVGTVRLTNIIEISYRSKTAQASVAVVNAVLRSYLDFMDKTHKGTAGELIKVFQKEKVEIENQLAKTSADVLKAREQYGDLGIPADSNVVHPMVQRVIELNQALIKAQQYRLEQQAALSTIETAVRNGEDLEQHFLALEGTIGRELMLSSLGFSDRDVAVHTEIEKQLLADQTELNRLDKVYGPNHPTVVAINDRVRMRQNYLASYPSRVKARLVEIREKQLAPMLMQMVRQRLNESWHHEASLRASFENARSEAVALIGERERLNLLEHDLRFLRGLRDALLDKIASVDLRQDHGDIRTAVVSEPILPKSPVWPRLSIIGMCSLMAGLGTGMGLIYILDVLDDRFRSPEEMRIQLGAPLLAMVRKMDDLHTVGLEGIQAHIAPDAPSSEAFRTLRTSLAFSGQETGRLVISSPEPGDGKTTVLANLAVSFCQAGKRVLMIDADMRRPGLSAQMGLKGRIGLSDLLASNENPDQAAPDHIHPLCPGLDLIPAGRRRATPTELLTTTRMAELLAWAESSYDQILIDTPPTLAAGDASIVARLVDGAVLVVQPAKNRRRLVTRSAETFTSLGVNLLGVVVNRVGDDKRETIYADANPYGYAYASDDDHEPHDGHAATVPLDEPLTTDDTVSAGPPAPAAGIVPRRVA
ncbi:MAG TPA: polysaccharide biosynthesis tyrosine autokinase [Pirellulales bacterium]|jgi:capsular exopolysaccharide synthesis family protein|nr:polysaccharide biosynthesis tyrosine autokinase [Pirellulales bacterium]